jgi:hypothetical protein
MTTLESLQEWYVSQCNEDWEHTYGIDIGTLDNPGWSLKVDLADTPLEGVSYPGHSYGVGAKNEPTSQDWLVCKVENRKFVGNGGPKKLEEMIGVFLAWAKANS